MPRQACRHCGTPIRPSESGTYWVDAGEWDNCPNQERSHDPAARPLHHRGDTMTNARKFGRDLVQALAREPRDCNAPDCRRNEQQIVAECPGCRKQRIAAGKTIEEWYDDGIARM